MDELRERRIDKAIDSFQKAKKLYELNKVLRDLREHPETFTAHIHRLRLPLPTKGL